MGGNGQKMTKLHLYRFLKQNWIKCILSKKYICRLNDNSNEKVKLGEISRRIKDTEKEIDQVIKELNNATEPPEEAFFTLEEEVSPLNYLVLIKVSDIIADVHDLAHYTQLNYTAFQKILVISSTTHF